MEPTGGVEESCLVIWKDLLRLFVIGYGAFVLVLTFRVYFRRIRPTAYRLRRKAEFRLAISRAAFVVYGMVEVAARLRHQAFTPRTVIIAGVFSMSLSALLTAMLLDREEEKRRKEVSMGLQKYGTGEVLPEDDGERVVEFDDEDQQQLAEEIVSDADDDR